MSDTHSAGEAAGAGTRVPEGDPPPSQGPHTPGWGKMYNSLYLLLDDARQAGNQAAADAYQSAVYNIADKVWTEFVRLGGDTEDLTPGHVSPTTRAEEAYRILERTALRAEHFNDWGAGRRDSTGTGQIRRLHAQVPCRPERTAPMSSLARYPAPDRAVNFLLTSTRTNSEPGFRNGLTSRCTLSPGQSWPTTPKARVSRWAELEYWQGHQLRRRPEDATPGTPPASRFADLNRAGDHATADELEALQGRLLEAMDDPSMYRTRASTGGHREYRHGWVARVGHRIPAAESGSGAAVRLRCLVIAAKTPRWVGVDRQRGV